MGAGGTDGVAVAAAQSEGDIEEGSGCQSSEGGSTLASAAALGLGTSSAGRPSTSSEACNDGTRTQRNNSSLLVLFDQPVPLPTPGCGQGDPDTLAVHLIPLAAVVCNADDTNGVGEDVQQTSTPYGVREALTAFVGIEGDTRC